MAKSIRNMATFLSTPKVTPRQKMTQSPVKGRIGKEGGFSVTTGKVIKDKSF